MYVRIPHQRVLLLPHSPEYLHISWAALAGGQCDSLHTGEGPASPPKCMQTYVYMHAHNIRICMYIHGCKYTEYIVQITCRKFCVGFKHTHTETCMYMYCTAHLSLILEELLK